MARAASELVPAYLDVLPYSALHQVVVTACLSYVHLHELVSEDGGIAEAGAHEIAAAVVYAWTDNLPSVVVACVKASTCLPFVAVATPSPVAPHHLVAF